MSPQKPVSSYLAISPLPDAISPKAGNASGGIFLLHCLCGRPQLSVRKYGALRCPDFPPGAFSGARRQTAILLSFLYLFYFTTTVESVISFLPESIFMATKPLRL